MLVEQQIILLYAAMNGYFDILPVSILLPFERELVSGYKSNDLAVLHLVTDAKNEISFDFFTYYLDITLTNLITDFKQKKKITENDI